MNRTTLAGAIVAALVATPFATADLPDAYGDAVDAFGMPTPLLDIDMIGVDYDSTTLYFEIMFNTMIAPASSGMPNAMVGYLEFDTDVDSGTGVSPLQNNFPSAFANLDTGVDFFVDFGSEFLHSGLANLVNAPGGFPVALIPVTYTNYSVSGEIPLSILGDDGYLAYTSIIGTINQPTDAADGVGLTQPIPAPAAVALLGLAGLTGRRRRH